MTATPATAGAPVSVRELIAYREGVRAGAELGAGAALALHGVGVPQAGYIGEAMAVGVAGEVARTMRSSTPIGVAFSAEVILGISAAITREALTICLGCGRDKDAAGDLCSTCETGETR